MKDIKLECLALYLFALGPDELVVFFKQLLFTQSLVVMYVRIQVTEQKLFRKCVAMTN